MESYKSIDPARWNACIKFLCEPLEKLDAIQRPAAIVFHYDGQVQNGGHTLHFDSSGAAHENDEPLHSLKQLGAHKQARILVEARMLKHEADEAPEGERDYFWESIEDLDQQYGKLRPDIPELLARYFNAHPDSFAK